MFGKVVKLCAATGGMAAIGFVGWLESMPGGMIRPRPPIPTSLLFTAHNMPTSSKPRQGHGVDHSDHGGSDGNSQVDGAGYRFMDQYWHVVPLSTFMAGDGDDKDATTAAPELGEALSRLVQGFVANPVMLVRWPRIGQTPGEEANVVVC